MKKKWLRYILIGVVLIFIASSMTYYAQLHPSDPSIIHVMESPEGKYLPLILKYLGFFLIIYGIIKTFIKPKQEKD